MCKTDTVSCRLHHCQFKETNFVRNKHGCGWKCTIKRQATLTANPWMSAQMNWPWLWCNQTVVWQCQAGTLPINVWNTLMVSGRLSYSLYSFGWYKTINTIYKGRLRILVWIHNYVFACLYRQTRPIHHKTRQHKVKIRPIQLESTECATMTKDLQIKQYVLHASPNIFCIVLKNSYWIYMFI